MNSHEIAAMETIEREASQLLSLHDGIHNMHGCYSNVVQWLANAKIGIAVDWPNVDLMMRQMRACHSTGFWQQIK